MISQLAECIVTINIYLEKILTEELCVILVQIPVLCYFVLDMCKIESFPFCEWLLSFSDHWLCMFQSRNITLFTD